MIWQSRAYKKHLAFTIVELIVTLLIAGILVAVASLAYSNYIRRTRLAEAFTLVDALGKSEINYFLTHKSFIGFLAPVANYPGSGTDQCYPNAPSNGKTLPIDSSLKCYNGQTYVNAGWEGLGHPLQDGSLTHFLYGGSPGKTNSQGQVVTFTGSSMDNPFVWSSGGTGRVIATMNANDLPPNRASACKSTYAMPYAIGPYGADLNWVILGAVANFNTDDIDPNVQSSPPWNKCTFVLKLIETNATGKLSTASKFIVETE